MSFEYKNELKNLLPEYMELLETEGVTENRGNGFWNCPFCGSGTGKNNTAAFHVYSRNDGYGYKCQSCGESGDIFDLVAHIEELPMEQWKRHYNRALQIMLPYLDKEHDAKPVEDKPRKQEHVEPKDYSEYLKMCHQNVSKTNYFKKRGLSEKTINRFKLGYDPKKNLVTIPYNSDCKGYVHRILWDGDNKYAKHGNEIFNKDALYEDGNYLFIVEGQIDCMSFEELGYLCLGLGGVNESDKLIELLDAPFLEDKTLILALDSDKAGKRATGILIQAIAESEVDFEYITVSDLYGEYKDANEYLRKDRDGFKQRIERLLNSGVV